MCFGLLVLVQVVIVVEQVVLCYFIGFGIIIVVNIVMVCSCVDGQLMVLYFQEGQQVKVGDLLVEIDFSQFKVVLV